MVALTLAPLSADFLIGLAEERLLRIRDRPCTACHQGAMSLANSDEYFDGLCMRCNRGACHRRCSIRQGSFFERHPNVPLPAYVTAIRLLQHQTHHHVVAEIVGLSTKTIGRIHSDLMEEVVAWNAANPVIFRAGEIVEVDCNVNQWKEALGEAWGGRIQLFHRGTMIFGMKSRQTKRIHLQLIESENSGAVCHVVQRHCTRGVIIMHDAAGAYRSVGDVGYQHHEINKAQQGFARTDEASGLRVHVNNIEAVWREKAEWILSRHGQLRRQMEDFIQEFIFIQNGNRFIDIIRL